MSAAFAVFSIPELLEHIISEHPPFDIIRYQRVSRTWQKLIAASSLLQYRAWLRNDFLDHTQYPYGSEAAKDYNTKRYIDNVSKHLHPVIVANIMKDLPDDPKFSFDPNQDMDKWGFGGYFVFRPVLLRALHDWYEKHKSSEHVWGHISLYRPQSRRCHWSVPCSDDSGIQFELEARHIDERDAGRYTEDYFGNKIVINKGPDEPLFLTLGDLLRRLDKLWDSWIDREREIHYLSHDMEGCDYNLGLPDYCLESSDEEEEDDEEDEEERIERIKFGEKMTVEEHIDACVRRASDK